MGGNPFFLLEMIDALLERGALEIRDTGGEGGEHVAVLARTERGEAGLGTLPSTLEQLLGDRLAADPSLTAPAKSVIHIFLVRRGAVAGGVRLARTSRRESDARRARLP